MIRTLGDCPWVGFLALVVLIIVVSFVMMICNDRK